jgi:hypothetical protein
MFLMPARKSEAKNWKKVYGQAKNDLGLYGTHKKKSCEQRKTLSGDKSLRLKQLLF